MWTQTRKGAKAQRTVLGFKAFAPWRLGALALPFSAFLLPQLFLPLHLYSADPAPNFAKLAAIAPGPALAAFAQTRNIPLKGLDAPGEPGRLSPGDSFTGLATLCEKSGRRTQWLLYLTTLRAAPRQASDKPAQPTVLYTAQSNRLEFISSPARVDLLTAGPFLLNGSKPARRCEHAESFKIDKGFLSLGLDRAAATIWRREQSKVEGEFWFSPTPPDAPRMAQGRKLARELHLTAEDERALGGLFPALFSYFELVEHTEGLEDILLKVIQKPSIWSMIRHAGVTAELLLDSEHIAPTEPTAWGLPAGTPAYDLPMLVRLNGQPALVVTFVVTSPRPPLLSCGGIVGMLAERPGDNQTFLTLRVVAARAKRN